MSPLFSALAHLATRFVEAIQTTAVLAILTMTGNFDEYFIHFQSSLSHDIVPLLLVPRCSTVAVAATPDTTSPAAAIDVRSFFNPLQFPIMLPLIFVLLAFIWF